MKVLEQVYACFRRKHDAVAAGGGRVEFLSVSVANRVSRCTGMHSSKRCRKRFPARLGSSGRSPSPSGSSEAAEFAEKHIERIGFFEFLQWQADEQLGRAQVRAGERGMPVGIYRDLAVERRAKGSMRGPTSRWSCKRPRSAARRTLQYAWPGLGHPPLHPLVLRARGYDQFIAMLRANMRHAGGLRIDHVMGLMHLFWIPAESSPATGAYVNYPFEELMGILALENQRNRCLIVGEDLGTVPAGFRERMDANVLSYRVLYFEKDGDRFKRPEEYPGLALACVTTHDLATLQGFWRGADLELKRRLKLYPSEEAQHDDEGARRWDKALLLRALHGEGLLPEG